MTVIIRRPRTRLFLDHWLPLLVLLRVVLTSWNYRSWWQDLALALLGVLVGVLSLTGETIELTPTHLREHGRGYRSTSWSRIRGIEIKRGFRGPSVWIHSDNGPVHRLRAPAPGPGYYWSKRFQTECDQLGQWWVDHRGPVWEPRSVTPSPAPGEQIVPLAPPQISTAWRRPG